MRYFQWSTPFSPPSGLATGSFNGLHTKSKFLAFIIQLWRWVLATLFVIGLAAGRAGAYTVTYDGNGATSGTAPAAQTKVQDVALTLAGTPDALVRTNYAFVCWNTAANGSGTDYSPGAGYTTNDSVTLYAKWTPHVPLKRYTAVPRPELAYPPADNGSASYLTYRSYRQSDLRGPFACSLGVTVPPAGSIDRYRAGLYESGSHLELGLPEGYTTAYAAGLSESLTVAATAYVGPSQAGNRAAFVVPHGGTPTALPINRHGSVAAAMSANGHIAGHTFDDDAGNFTLAALWSPSGDSWSLQTFAPLAPDTSSRALAVNNLGDVVGMSGSRAVLWPHDSPSAPVVMTTLGNAFFGMRVNGLGQVSGDANIWSATSGAVSHGLESACGLGSQGEAVGFGKDSLSWSIFNGAVVAELDALVTAGDLRLHVQVSSDAIGIDDNGRIIAYGYRIHPDGTPADRYPPNSWSSGGNVRYSYFELTPVADADAYVVTYHANGAASGHVPVRQAKIPDKPLVLASNGRLLAKPGFTFAGWNTAADGSGTHYDVGSIYTANAVLTLYPEWTTQATYLVQYQSAPHGNAPHRQTKVHGQPLTLAHNYTHLFRPGYVFGGWSTSWDGSGADYAEGATYLNNAPLTLYPKWIATDTRYPVVYLGGDVGITGTYPSPQIKTLGVALTLATNSGNLARPGYTFAGWNTGPDGDGTDYAAGGSYTRDEALTLNPKWVVSGNASPVISSAWADANTVTLPAGTTVHVTATDSNGDTLYYSWSKVSGPGTTTFAAYNAANSTVTFNAVGTFVLRVTVSDLKSVNATADVTVTVNGSTVPAAPTGFAAAAAGTNRIDLQWTDNATSETSYVVERSLDDNTWSLTTLASVGATNHGDTTVAADTLYHYRVSAYNAMGPSAFAYASARTLSDYEVWKLHYWPDGTAPETVTKRGRPVPLYEVFVADLDPFDGNSVLEITRIDRLWMNSAWHVVLEFAPTSPRRLYDVASTSNLAEWNVVIPDIAPGESSVQVELPEEGSRRFYRIGVRLPPP